MGLVEVESAGIWAHKNCENFINQCCTLSEKITIICFLLDVELVEMFEMIKDSSYFGSKIAKRRNFEVIYI